MRSNTAGVSLTAPAAVALRSNRHTLVYGAGAVPAVLEVTGTINGKSQTWTVAGGALRQGGSEIGVLARKAQQTQGLNSPYLGLEGLAAASGDFTSLIGESIAAAEVLSQQGQKLQALEIVSQARLLDSGNVRLTALETALLDETGKADRLGADEATLLLTPVDLVFGGSVTVEKGERIDGVVAFEGTVRGKRKLVVKNEETAQEEEHLIATGKLDGLAPGNSGGDQEMIQEEGGPANDRRNAIRPARGEILTCW